MRKLVNPTSGEICAGGRTVPVFGVVDIDICPSCLLAVRSSPDCLSDSRAPWLWLPPVAWDSVGRNHSHGGRSLTNT